jgi:hypothetical protein
MGQLFVTALIGAGLLLAGLFQLRKVRASRSWIKTTGKVYESTVQSEFSRGTGDDPDKWVYYPLVRYQYWTGTEWLCGDRIGFDRHGFGSPAKAQAVLARYPVEAQVEVFFDPANPAQAVLLKTSGSGWVLSIVGAVILLLALAAAFK